MKGNIRRMRSQNVTASKRSARFLPWAFTEHGALMAANILQSERAIAMSVELINTFIRLRQMALSVEELARKVEALVTFVRAIPFVCPLIGLILAKAQRAT